MKEKTIFILLLVVVSLLPLQTEEAAGNALIPDFRIEMDKYYVLINAEPGGNPTGQVAVTIINPTIHQLTVRVTVSGPGITITPQIFVVTLAGGGDITTPVAVAVEPGTIDTIHVLVWGELERHNGVPPVYPKQRSNAFMVIARPYADLGLENPILNIFETGWSQQVITLRNDVDFGQFFDVGVSEVSTNLEVAESSTRIFIPAMETLDYPILINCEKTGPESFDITLTPDYGEPQVFTILVNEKDTANALYGKNDPVPEDGTGADLTPALLVLAALAALLFLALRAPNRQRLPVLPVLILVLAALVIPLHGENASALTVGCNPGEFTEDAFILEVELTVTSQEVNEKTYAIRVEGDVFCVHTSALVVPAGQSVTTSMAILLEYYAPHKIVSVSIELDETENEGVPVDISTGVGSSDFTISYSGSDSAVGNLDPAEYVRIHREGASENIDIDVIMPQAQVTARLIQDDEEIQNMEMGESSGGSTEFSCQLNEKQLELEEPYTILLEWEGSSKHYTQSMNIVFREEKKGDESNDGDDDDSLPGFGISLLLVSLVSGTCIYHYKGSNNRKRTGKLR